jgi:hypothetical protein
MAISSVVTEGYGPGASIALVVTSGYAIGQPLLGAAFRFGGGAWTGREREYWERERDRWERQRPSPSPSDDPGRPEKELEAGLGAAEAARLREALERYAALRRRQLQEQDDEDVLLLIA